MKASDGGQNGFCCCYRRQSCANAESGYASHCGGSGFPHRTAEDEHMPEAPLVCVRNAWRDEGSDVFRGDYVQPKRGSNRLVRGTDWSDIGRDRKSTRLNSSHEWISYAVFCLKKKNVSTRT